MTLNVVVLPAPFGPIRPVIAPASTSRSTARTAWCPPKWTLIPRVSSSAIVPTRSCRCGRDALTERAEVGVRVTERQLHRLRPTEVAVDRVVDVEADAAVEVLRGVHDA